MAKKQIILILIAVLIVAAGGTGYYYYKIYLPAKSATLESEKNAGTTQAVTGAEEAAQKISESAAQGALPSIDTNPLKDVPDTNVLNKTNPFSDIKTNPFR